MVLAAVPVLAHHGGAGFDTKTKGLGAGFTNMSDRLGAIGGTFSVESAPGKGTKISGRIPLN
jgi:signal transduction histidine kinase